MSAFDPAAWLAAFAQDGGSYAVTSENRLWLGVVGMACCDVPRHTVDLIGHPERVAAIVAHVREQCLIA